MGLEKPEDKITQKCQRQGLWTPVLGTAPEEEDTNSTGCPLDLQPSSEKLSAELQLPSPRELQRYLPPALEQEHAPRSSTTQNVPW